MVIEYEAEGLTLNLAISSRLETLLDDSACKGKLRCSA